MAPTEFPAFPNLVPDLPSHKEIESRLAEGGSAVPPVVRRAVADCLTGEISPNVALARLLLETGRVEPVEASLAVAAERWGEPLPAGFAELIAMVRDNREGCERAADLLREHPSPEPVADVEETIDSNRRFFDAAVRAHEEVSVAAYALGNPALLAAATQEIVDLFERWGLLGPERTALEIGCGIGRMQVGLSPYVGQVHGIDISPGMIAAARRRCAGLGNVHLAVSSGEDLSPFPSGSLDLVFAVDSFPYIHQAGPDLVEAYFDEVDRVLRPGGDFVLLNYSYRDDLAADREEVEALCEETGFVLEVQGIEPFTVWDGIVFLCRKPGSARQG